MIDAPERGGASALYGRRKGKKLRPAQAARVETLLPALTVDVTQPIEALGRLFPREPADFWLEIGFGGGEHLLAAAARHRDVGFIGCEPFVNGVAKFLAALDEAHLENVRLHCGDAGEVIDVLPEASVGRVFLFYPDPWPKWRQRKRRFLSDDMLRRLARVMKPGAELRFATDIDDNAGWTLARVLRSDDFVWEAARAAEWQQPWADWPGTRYEAKAAAEGRRPTYLTFQRL